MAARQPEAADVSAPRVHHLPATPPALAQRPGHGRRKSLVETLTGEDGHVETTTGIKGFDPSLPGGSPALAKRLAEDDLWNAARRGDATAVERFIRSGMPVAAQDECNRTASYYASLYGHDELATLLVDYESKEAIGSLDAAAVTLNKKGPEVSGDDAGTGTADPDAPKSPGKAKDGAKKKRRKPKASAAAAEGGGTSDVDDAAGGKGRSTAKGKPPLGDDGKPKDARRKAPGAKLRSETARDGPALLEHHNKMARDRAAIRRKRLRALERRQLFEDLEARKNKWLKTRGLQRGFEFTRTQKKELKRWFDFIDADGSGEINVEELEDPLLSTGIARNTAELQKLIEAVDTDGSGEIGFDEFLAVLRPRGGGGKEDEKKGGEGKDGGGRGGASGGADGGGGGKTDDEGEGGSGGGGGDDESANAFRVLQQQLNDENQMLPLQLMVTMHRRKFLLETIVGNPDAEDAARRQLEAAEDEAHRTNNIYRLSQIKKRQREQEVDKARRNERLMALQGVVDRQKRREAAADAERARIELEDAAAAAAATAAGAPTHHRKGSSTAGARGARANAGPAVGRMGGKIELSAADKERLDQLKTMRDVGPRRGRAPVQRKLVGAPGGKGAGPRGARGAKEAKGVPVHQLNMGGGMQFNPSDGAAAHKDKGDRRGRRPKRTATTDM